MKIKNERLAKEGKTADQIADEIVELLLSSAASADSKRFEKFGKIKTKIGGLKTNALERRNLMEIVKLKSRINSLENRVEKYIRNFKISATESNRLVSEKTENLGEGIEERILNLQGQIEKLRTAMIRLSSEVKNLKEKFG